VTTRGLPRPMSTGETQRADGEEDQVPGHEDPEHLSGWPFELGSHPPSQETRPEHDEIEAREERQPTAIFDHLRKTSRSSDMFDCACRAAANGITTAPMAIMKFMRYTERLLRSELGDRLDRQKRRDDDRVGLEGELPSHVEDQHEHAEADHVTPRPPVETTQADANLG